MRQTFFIPARNSRHRIAALALYRALVRTARKIDLPQDARPNGDVHSVAKIVRKRFEGNKNYTSLRLVYSSLAAGYKFLTMLTKAQVPESREYAEVVSHLRERIATSAASRSSKPPRRLERDPLPPLLRNVAPPDEAPKYVVEPRSEETLRGKRRVPQLCATSDGLPFLRYQKPHPQVLNRMIGRKRLAWNRGIDNVAYVEEELAPDAALEDRWENSMEELMRGQQGVDPKPRLVEASDTYLWSAVVSKLWCEWRLERTWRDWNARGEAMHQLVEKERDLVEKEKTDSGDAALAPLSAAFETRQPEDQRPPEEPEEPERLEGLKEPPRQKQRLPTASSNSQSKARVAAFNTMPALNAATATTAELKRKGIPINEDKDDPFVSPVWAGVIEKSDGRLKRWMASTPHADARNWAWKSQGQARQQGEDEELSFFPSKNRE